MWAIIKVDLKKLSLFNEDLKKKLGSEFKIYVPKIKIQMYKKNKLINKNIPLLGNYVFFFHKEFNNLKIIDSLKFTRGLKYFLNGCHFSQNEIKAFINKCQSLENKKGYIAQNFLNLNLNSFYSFKSGLFTNKIFELIELQKNKIKILINGVKIQTNNKDFLVFTHN